MAKKTRTTTKKSARKTASASSSKKKSAARSAKKKTTKKPAAKKSTRAPSRKTSSKKKVAASKKTAKKTAKKTTKKKVAKKPAAKKKVAKKPSAKKAPTKKKATTKKPAAKKTTKKVASSKAETSKAPAKDASGKPVRKGITIVSDRPRKKTAPKKLVAKFPPTGDRLLGPGSPIRKPLIPSGPGRRSEVSRLREASEPSGKKVKSPFNKRELDKFRAILLAKRAELFGDMSQMESGALRSNSGNLSHTPQHFAEQGSESYDQSLSLDLAAADRRLIVEIDDALQRIENKTFGICELTGKAIKKTRLDELPWARHSIDAARELERRSGFRA